MSEEVILFPILFSLIGFVIWTIFSTIRRYKTTQLQAGLQTKLLEKFGSGQELLAYVQRSEEHTSELQSRLHLVCRLLLEKKKTNQRRRAHSSASSEISQASTISAELVGVASPELGYASRLDAYPH